MFNKNNMVFEKEKLVLREIKTDKQAAKHNR